MLAILSTTMVALFLITLTVDMEILGGDFVVSQAKDDHYVISLLRDANLDHQRQSGTLPASLQALTGIVDYTELRLIDTSRLGFFQSNVINDGNWRFVRAITYKQQVSDYQFETDYIIDNTCGTGSALTASDWCGNDDSTWAVIETRDNFAPQFSRQDKALSRTAQRLGDEFSISGVFPNTYGVTTMTDGDSATLQTILGVAGTASNCTGNYTWGTIVFACDDIFSEWGTPITYFYANSLDVSLVARSDVLDNLGNIKYIALTVSG